MSQTVHHATIRLERRYDAPAEKVFAEFADPIARARWSAPSGDTLVYDESDFRIGGKDVFRCGPQGDLKFRGETRYLSIEPNLRVLSSETLQTAGQTLAVSLNTLELDASDGGVTVTVTVQIASFVGPGLVAGFESGHQSALDGLAQHLAAGV